MYTSAVPFQDGVGIKIEFANQTSAVTFKFE